MPVRSLLLSYAIFGGQTPTKKTKHPSIHRVTKAVRCQHEQHKCFYLAEVDVYQQIKLKRGDAKTFALLRSGEPDCFDIRQNSRLILKSNKSSPHDAGSPMKWTSVVQAICCSKTSHAHVPLKDATSTYLCPYCKSRRKSKRGLTESGTVQVHCEFQTYSVIADVPVLCKQLVSLVLSPVSPTTNQPTNEPPI